MVQLPIIAVDPVDGLLRCEAVKNQSPPDTPVKGNWEGAEALVLGTRPQQWSVRVEYRGR